MALLETIKKQVIDAMKAKDTVELEACEWGGTPEG